MKFLIWTLCIVPAAFLMVLIENAGGSSMGALPKTLIAGGAFALAVILCKQVDANKKEEAEKDENNSNKSFLDDQKPLKK